MSNEWYTPPKYIEAARNVMGSIDLDPASCELANQTVKATKYYTEEQNGLMQPWYGNVWLNPPYGRIHPERTGSIKSFQKAFARKILQEYDAKRTEQVILLMLGNACFMKWFQPFWNHPLCFHDGRILFNKPDGSTDNFGFGTIFVYLGSQESHFVEVFSQFGRVARAIDTPKPHLTVRELWDEVGA